MIHPLLSDDAFLADVEAASHQPESLHLWWLGQSGYLLQFGNTRLLLDPYLSDSLTEKYAKTDKPHTRMTSRVIDPARLPRIDLITSSHGHTDHLDAQTLQPIAARWPAMKMLAPRAIGSMVAERLGRPADVLLSDGETWENTTLRITAVPAAHNTLDRDARGNSLYLGFIVRLGRWTIYHSGDTLLYEGMADLLRHWPIDLALLPINGNDPARRVAGNLSGEEAAALAHEIGAALVIPCHYELFEFNTASPQVFVAECDRLKQPHRLLRAGERLTLA